MLVLSRGQNDRIVFPALGISVEILRLDGKRVRIGIDAPKDVSVLRGELASKLTTGGPEGGIQANSELKFTHAVRNRLQKATLALHLLQRTIERGGSHEVEPTIFQVLNELKALEQEFDPSATRSNGVTKDEKAFRALVVEDDPNENELLAGFLRLSGFEVDTAMDGLQAMVRLSKTERPDVVLLDMKMPRFDGRKTVSAIRQNPDYQHMKIFAVTGTGPDEAEVSVGPGGVDRWFTKPIDPARLVDAFHSDHATELATA